MGGYVPRPERSDAAGRDVELPRGYVAGPGPPLVAHRLLYRARPRRPRGRRRAQGQAPEVARRPSVVSSAPRRAFERATDASDAYIEYADASPSPRPRARRCQRRAGGRAAVRDLSTSFADGRAFLAILADVDPSAYAFAPADDAAANLRHAFAAFGDYGAFRGAGLVAVARFGRGAEPRRGASAGTGRGRDAESPRGRAAAATRRVRGDGRRAARRRPRVTRRVGRRLLARGAGHGDVSGRAHAPAAGADDRRV